MYYDLNSFYGFIKVSGSDAKTFLQGQLSCDVEKIDDQHTSLGVACGPKGRIQSLFRLIKIEHDYFLRVPKAICEHTLAHLQKYAIFSKVNLSLCQNEIFIYGAINQEASDALLSLTPFNHAVEWYTHAPCHTATTEISDWRKEQLEEGIPEIYPETLGQFTPHNLNLQCIEETLSFHKGCYTGQEIIARMHYRGQLKQHMYAATATHAMPIKAYTPILTTENKCVGHVVDSVISDNDTHLLISMKDSAKESTLHLEGGVALQLNKRCYFE